ncbi:MAG: RND transporter MFP subunit [Flavobacteriaceae bacterium]|jgi:HlyD family secretion protein|nr:MAG: RND transporter MFP subunit [Flavobacteriaceae bacterium]|tara:strand:- start:3281 stop:4423 length:1143 start_codon:yes stop_codon:yes gene_type:complete
MKNIKNIGFVLIALGLLFSIAYYIKTNSRSAITYETEQLKYKTIEDKIVATGSVVPEDEVNIVPQISGIIQEIFVDEGDQVKAGDLLAKIKVIPNEQTLNSAEGRVKTTQIILQNSEKEYNRNKKLFEKGIISEQDFNSIELRYNQDKQSLENAKSDLQIIRLGSIGGSALTNTNVRSTISGTILQVPVKEGDQAIEANTFNPGTTIATVADLNKMIFEGRVDEGEVSKLKTGLPLKIEIGAIEDKVYDAKLTLIAPKGIEVAGAIQFQIEGEVYLDDEYIIRAGYSANATIVTQTKENVLAIDEYLLQFDNKTKEAFVEIEISDQNFEKRQIEVGISDGVFAEVLSGVTINDKIKVWNKTEPIKRGDVEDVDDEYKLDR